MGGCCGVARNDHLDGSTAYYYYPPTLEDDEAFASREGPVPAITSGLLANADIEPPVPDNFRAPPSPLPYDVVLHSQSAGAESDIGRANSFNTFSVCRDPLAAGHKSQPIHLVITPKKLEELSESDEVDISVAADEDEDICPICLEEYDEENPMLLTKCDHDFHLSCLLEWMERSDTCPICDKVVVLDHSFD